VITWLCNSAEESHDKGDVVPDGPCQNTGDLVEETMPLNIRIQTVCGRQVDPGDQVLVNSTMIFENPRFY
jgi:hypothetical protein